MPRCRLEWGMVEPQPFMCAQVDFRVSPASLTWLQVGMLRKDVDANENTTYQVQKVLLHRLFNLKENLHFDNLKLKKKVISAQKKDFFR